MLTVRLHELTPLRVLMTRPSTRDGRTGKRDDEAGRASRRGEPPRRPGWYDEVTVPADEMTLQADETPLSADEMAISRDQPIDRTIQLIRRAP